MGAIRCPDCRKFATVNAEVEPVVSDEEFDQESGKFTCSIRMVNECECGVEIAESTFEVELDFSDLMKEHDCPEKETGEGWSAEDAKVERYVEERPPNAKRRAKFYGVRGSVDVVCNCKEKKTLSLDFEDECKASDLEVLV